MAFDISLKSPQNASILTQRKSKSIGRYRRYEQQFNKIAENVVI